MKYVLMEGLWASVLCLCLSANAYSEDIKKEGKASAKTDVVASDSGAEERNNNIQAQKADNSEGSKAGSEERAKENAKENPEEEELLVLGHRKAAYTEITEDTQKLVKMPGALGDPLGAITSLPGVLTPSSGGAPVVRGGSPEDNRFYIDGMPAGYIFHQFNTSIFDENVVQDFQLFSAGFGAQYSEATGAVFDIRLREPKHKELETKISASMLRAGVFTEGEITENSAFYLSARKGLIQFFLPEEDEANDEGFRIISAPQDSDYQLKTLWDVNDNNKITLSMAGARDFAEAEITEVADFVQKNPDFEGDAKIDRKFDSQALNWEHARDSGGEFRLTVANYQDSDTVEWGDGYFLNLKLQNSLARGHYSKRVTSNHTLSFGGEYNNKTYEYSARLVLFVCTEFDVDCESERRGLLEDSRELSIAESSIYLIDNWQVTNSVNIEAGIQRSGNDYTEEYFVNPRLAISWDLTNNFTLMSSAGKYNRTPDIEAILPELGNPDLKSYRADHFTFGAKGDIGHFWNWSLEGYYKKLTELPLSLDESEPDGDQLFSNDVEGEVRGFDLMINKSLEDKWYGWVALSYSKSERTNLRTGDTFDYTFDTPIVFNAVGNYQISERWNAGFRFTAKSGEATTKIIDIEPNAPHFPDRYRPVYGEPFADRLPLYYRLDLRAEKFFEIGGKASSFYLDILNVTNRKNVAERVLNYEKVNETGELHIEESAEMGIFGSVGFSIIF